MTTRLKRPIDATTRQGTTPERLAKANGNLHVQNGVQYMRDSMLDCALNRRRISSKQYEAGEKYRHHWYHAGMAGNLISHNFEAIARAEALFGGMARTENEAFHRQQYRKARRELERVECLNAVEGFVLFDTAPVDLGYALTRWKSRQQAEAAALERIQIGLHVLVGYFGI